VTSTQGCTDTDSVTVTVALPKKIDIPNILSPNDDGYNDTWDLSGVPDIDQSKITVLNRWGKVVFETENYQHDWGGTYNGEPLPDGTYMYIIEGSDVYDAFRGPLQITR
jgi:gliding motility-associated-like protein